MQRSRPAKQLGPLTLDCELPEEARGLLALEAPPAITFRRTRLADALKDCRHQWTPKDPWCRRPSLPRKHEPEGSRFHDCGIVRMPLDPKLIARRLSLCGSLHPKVPKSWIPGPKALLDHLDPLISEPKPRSSEDPKLPDQSRRKLGGNHPKPTLSRMSQLLISET